jgi:hypothetical protein
MSPNVCGSFAASGTRMHAPVLEWSNIAQATSHDPSEKRIVPVFNVNRRACRSSKTVLHDRHKMLKKMVRPVYESAVSALYIDRSQFGSTVNMSGLADAGLHS